MVSAVKLYKLTTQDFKTRKGYSNELIWGPCVTHSVPGNGTRMCSGAVIHAYPSALLAVLCNSIHANLKNPILWEAEGAVVASDGLKVGVKSLTTLHSVSLPKVTANQAAAFAILCALEGPVSAAYREWAENWLSGKDRTARAARAAAAREVRRAARAAWSAADAAARAADAAADAADAAARAADAAAWSAARAAAWPPDAAYAAPDFVDIAEKAMKYA